MRTYLEEENVIHGAQVNQPGWVRGDSGAPDPPPKPPDHKPIGA